MSLKVGDTYNLKFTIDSKTFNGFIDVFNDKNPLHTDTAFAVANGFEGRVMHGNIMNGFISYFIGECLPIKEVIIHSQEIKFKNPVYLNDELDFKATILAVFESVNTVEFKYYFKNKALKTVAKGKIQIGVLK